MGYFSLEKTDLNAVMGGGHRKVFDRHICSQ